MTQPNPSAVTVGAGTLWFAPAGTAPPAAGVLSPVTSPATSVAWPSAFIQIGFTTDGSEFDWTPKFDPLEVAEQLIPIRYVASMAEASIAFAMAEITAQHVSLALNGGTVVTASGITTFTPPVIGTEVRVAIGWDRIDGLERIIWRQCIQTDDVKQEHKKSPAMNKLPSKFMLEQPSDNGPLFYHYFDASLAA
jgi:hypothetical protein